MFKKFNEKLSDAKNKMAEVVDNASEGSDKLKEKMGNTLQDAKTKMSDVVETASGGTEKVKEFVGNTLADINQISPILADAGFTVSNIFLVAGIPPSFGLNIEQTAGEKRSLAEILEDETLELSKFQSSILSGLKRIYDMNDMVEANGHSISCVTVEIGISPKVTAQLTRIPKSEETSDAPQLT